MERTRKKPMIIMLVCVGVLFGGIFGYQAFKSKMIKKYMGSMAAPAVTVSAMQVGYETWQSTSRAAGTLRAVNGVDVTTEVSGLVHAIHFNSGAAVKAGEVLVELNADPDTARLHSLQAAAELAKTIYQRDKAQYAIHAISKATVDASSADLQDKEAQVAQQAAMLEQKTIRAPFDGRLGVSAINVGQYLNPGDKIVTLQALDPMYVDFYMPQQVLAYLKIGQAVALTTDTYPDQIFAGKITTIDPKVDSTTRNVHVEAMVPNAQIALLPGMFASVEVMTGGPKRYLTLPQTAVSFNPYGEVIFIVHAAGKSKEGKPVLRVKQTFVTSGDKRGDQVAIIKGLKEGDRVVTSGQLKLKNDAEIVINNQITLPNDAVSQSPLAAEAASGAVH
jgi:membrane fusion protein (multidrug efflux system)